MYRDIGAKMMIITLYTCMENLYAYIKYKPGVHWPLSSMKAHVSNPVAINNYSPEMKLYNQLNKFTVLYYLSLIKLCMGVTFKIKCIVNNYQRRQL